MSDIIDEIPAFLREFLKREYGSDAERIFAGYEVRRPVTLRANRLKTTADAAEEALRAHGIAVRRVGWYADAFVLEGVRESVVEETELYRRGEVYLQSLSSMLPPLALRPAAGESVLDMTAAPGGKTTQMAALSEGKALITACEKDAVRFSRLQFNLARQGASRVTALNADACKLDPFLRFDKVLLDAPCSGSGTFLCGVPQKISQRAVECCVRAQEALLKKGLSLLKAGGLLVYSTCSVLKEENEEVFFRALKGTDAHAEPVDLPFLGELPLLRGEAGTVTVCPDGLFEGFFLAAARKGQSSKKESCLPSLLR